MIERIDNICKIEFAPITSIDDLDIDLIEKLVTLKFIPGEGWSELDCSPGPSLSIEDTNNNSGRIYNSQVTCSMRSELNDKRLMIVRITLENGTSFLLGDMDLPVSFQESHQLQSKSLSFSQSSWHYPFEVQITSGSDSGSGGL